MRRILTTTFIFLLAFYSANGEEKNKLEDKEDPELKNQITLDEYEKNLPDGSREVKKFECTDNTVADITKIIENGEKIDKNKAKDKNVIVVFGMAGSQKSLLANLLAKVALDKKSTDDINAYPRYVGEDANGAVIYEAATLNEGSIASQAAAAYFITEITKEAKGVKLVFAYKKEKLPNIFEYFKAIPDVNSKVGMFELAKIESFVHTGIDDPQVAVKFGNHPSYLMNEEKLKDEKNMATNLQKVQEALGGSKFLSPLQFPVFPDYKKCLKTKLPEKISKDLKDLTAGVLSYFEGIDKDASMSDYTKNNEIGKALKNFNVIKNLVTFRSVPPEEVANVLVAFLESYNKTADAEKAVAVGQNTEVLATACPDLQSRAWAEGLKPLWKYLRTMKTQLEFGAAMSGDSLECKNMKQRALANVALYELEFEKAIRPKNNPEHIARILKDVSSSIGGDFSRLYKEKAEEDGEKHFEIVDKVYDKLKKYKEMKCPSNTTKPACKDEKKSKELADMIEMGTQRTESKRQDQIVLVVGTKSAPKTMVANCLAGQQIEQSTNEDSPPFPKFIIDPIGQGYSIFTSPNFKNDAKEVEKVAKHYFNTVTLNSGVAAKLIVTVEEKSLKDAAEMQLVMGTFAKISGGVQSVGFVVTNVEVGDKLEEKVKSISESLIKVIEKQAKNEKISKEARSVLEFFVEFKNITSKNIAVLPNDKKLADENTFQTYSKHIKSVIDDTVVFESYKYKNYLEMLSEAEGGIAQCTAKIIGERLVEKIATVAEPLKQLYRQWEDEAEKHFSSIFERFDSNLKNFLTVVQKIQQTDKISGVFDPFKFYTIKLQMELQTDSILLLQSYARFLKMSDGSFADAVNSGFKNVKVYLQNSRRWYYFIGKVDYEYSRHSVMKNMENYITPAETLLGKIRTDSAELKDVDAFIDKIDDSPQKELKALHGMADPNLAKLRYMGFLVDRLFTTQQEIDCSDNKMICSGTYVLLSKCMQKKCDNSFHTEIQATNMVYIDEDYQETGGVLSIIAPEWYIIGNISINLNADDIEQESTRAENGVSTGAPGMNGKPGVPGKQGGNFLGVQEVVIYEEKSSLVISANGGRGGQGQSGGDGATGREPDDVSVPGNMVDNRIDFPSRGYPTVREQKRRGEWDIYLNFNGTPGGKGGDGGIGGDGGLAGLVKLVSLGNHKSSISESAAVGARGENGSGGKEGATIRKHHDLYEKYGSVYYGRGFSRTGWRYTKDYTSKWEVFGTTSAGISGKNEEGKKPAKEAEKIPNFALTLNRYKYFFRTITTKKTRFLHHRDFHRKLVDKPELIELYSAAAIADDFLKLESHAFQLKTKTSVVPYYDMIIDEINSFTNKSQLNEDEKKVLAHIYTSTLGKLAAERSKETFVVISLPGYLSIIKEEIGKLKNLENDELVKSYRKDYKDNVDNKIKEAQGFIDNVVMPYIKNYEEKLSNQIPALIADVAERKKQNRLNKAALEEQEKKLRKSCLIRKVMAGLNCVVSLTSFLGPTAAAIGGAISAGARVIDATVLSSSPSEAEAKLLSIPAAVSGQLVTVIALMENKKTAFTDQLSDISGRLDKMNNSTDVTKIKEKVEYTKTEVGKIDPKKLDPNAAQKMQDLRNDLSKTMQESKAAVSLSLEKDAKIDKKIENIGRLQTILSMGDQMARDYQAIKKSDDELDQCGLAIKQSDVDLKKLEAYESSVYTEMLPLVNDVNDRVSGLSEANKGKSHAALDVSEWKTAEYLSDMKITLTKMTEGFDASDEIRKVISKVEGGVQLMMKLFQRMGDEQDKSDLAIFLGDINSNKASSVKVKDETLNAILSKIEVSIQRNIILQRYELCRRSFMQSLFPFGAEIFRDFTIPENVGTGKNVETLITYAKQRVTEMINNIQTSETTISSGEYKVFNKAYFLGDEDGLEPSYYDWPYKNNKEDIDKLFKGETVQLESDIRRISEDIVDFIGLKFHILRLAFVAANKKVNKKLQKELNGAKFDLVPISDFTYKCSDKFFRMSSSKFIINYSHKTDENSEVLARVGNDVYTKIKDNKAIFSPYNIWNVTMVGVKSVMKKMAAYSGKHIDMKLIGRGFYVEDDGQNICEEDLDAIYNRDRSMFTILPVDEPVDEDDEDEESDEE